MEWILLVSLLLLFCTYNATEFHINRTSLHSQIATSFHGAAVWLTRRNVLDSGPLAHYYVKTWCHPQNRKYVTLLYYVAYCYILSSEKNRATAADNTGRKFNKIWTCGFLNNYMSGQTDIQAYTQTRWLQYLLPPPPGHKYFFASTLYIIVGELFFVAADQVACFGVYSATKIYSQKWRLELRWANYLS